VRPVYGGAASNAKTAKRFYPFDFSLSPTSAFSPLSAAFIYFVFSCQYLSTFTTGVQAARLW
jgi:hypothetical protein